MRPTYETERDRSREDEIMGLIEDIWDCNLVKMDKRQILDFAAMRNGEVTAWIEYKYRNYDWAKIDRFGGYMLSLKKWEEGHRKVMDTAIPFLIIVNCLGDIRFWRVRRRDNPKIGFGGRTDRNDPLDTEPVVFLPVKNFQKFPSANGD